ncbi:Uncharacterized conserved protein, DUF2336 family [Kaistia soli DSM 19436]|uniref:Uncharacterized conserved protein, DUF2336 family n=1 Tax=Kaistia soli DSM 19436 TaxID=1122133 RepID=A0A1M5AKF7_9HYPH|nr:DUF2336 domain-containing protein [Kaistia soli]SHF30739.1 Uncharacterized conserved protein, DUF2336 family [Kaistia soli DSM 19436]
MIVRQFLEWLETAPAGRRAEAAHAMARAYLYSEVDSEARADMEAAMTVLLDDPATEVRYALADALAVDARAPRHIILTLAGDHIDIAGLVLTCSPTFIDPELVDIVAAADGARQAAIAARLPVSRAVAAAIAEVGEAEACMALLDNPDSSIAAISLARLAERHGEDASIRDRLLERADLPPDIRQMLIRRLGDRLGAFVAAKAWIAPDRARFVTRDACERATIAIAAESATEDLGALVEHLRVTGQLTTALLLRAVCAGNIDLFEAALAILSRIPEGRVAGLVRSGRPAALRAIYKKAGLPASAFDAFAAAIETAREAAREAQPVGRHALARRTVERVMERYRAITDGEANELLAMLRRYAAEEARESARAVARAVRSAA